MHPPAHPARPPVTVAAVVGALAGAVVGALVAVAAAVAGAWRLAAEPVARLACGLPGSTRCAAVGVEDTVLGACGLALLGCLVWLLLAVAVAVASVAAARLSPEGPVAAWLDGIAERTCPGVVRRAVVLVAGAALGAAAGAAQAAPAAPAAAGAPAPVRADAAPLHAPVRDGADGRQRDLRDLRDLLGGLPLPDRVTGAGAPASAPVAVLRAHPARTAPGPPDVVTVRPGDSLWSIAARLLGPGASDAQVARAWHRIAALNSGRLGSDPDLILPGTRLAVPDLPRP